MNDLQRIDLQAAKVAAKPVPEGEPADGSYVAVNVALFGEVWTFRRDDAYALAEEEPGRRWRLVCHVDPDRADGSDRTWAEVCQLGPVAYVGAFVDRTGKEACRG